MNQVDFNLQYETEGLEVPCHRQVIAVGGNEIAIEVYGLAAEACQRASVCAMHIWAWICGHFDEMKRVLVRDIVEAFQRKRRQGIKEVPRDNFVSIGEKIKYIHKIEIQAEGSFQVFFPLVFDEKPYEAYLKIDQDFSFVEGNLWE